MTGILNVDQINNSAGTGAPSFPNGVAGATAGTAQTTGNIGETITWNSGGTGSVLTGGAVTVTSPTLGAGTWMLTATLNYTGLTAADAIAANWTGEGGTSDTVSRGQPDGSTLTLPLRTKTFLQSTSGTTSFVTVNGTANRGTVFYSATAYRIA